MAATQDEVAPVWCVIANVRDGKLLGENAKWKGPGLRQFSPGTKLYVSYPEWDIGLGRLKVVGRQRGTQSLVTVVVHESYLENWRVKLVRSPNVLKKMKRDFRALGWKKEDAEAYAKEMRA